RLRDGRWFLLVQTKKRGPSLPTVFDPATDRVEHQHEDPAGWSTVAVTHDGRLAVRTHDTALELYELRTGARRARLFADHALWGALFSADDTRLLVGDHGGLVHVLELGDLATEAPAAGGRAPGRVAKKRAVRKSAKKGAKKSAKKGAKKGAKKSAKK